MYVEHARCGPQIGSMFWCGPLGGGVVESSSVFSWRRTGLGVPAAERSQYWADHLFSTLNPPGQEQSQHPSSVLCFPSIMGVVVEFGLQCWNKRQKIRDYLASSQPGPPQEVKALIWIVSKAFMIYKVIILNFFCTWNYSNVYFLKLKHQNGFMC